MTPAVGDTLPPLQKKIFQRSLAQRKWSEDSIHNDNYTKAQGYPGALVSAYVLAGYVSEPMVAFFGPAWFTTGTYDLKFVGKGVQQGDPITIGGEVTSLEDLGEAGRKVTLNVWIEKADGARPVLGVASAILPPSA